MSRIQTGRKNLFFSVFRRNIPLGELIQGTRDVPTICSNDLFYGRNFKGGSFRGLKCSEFHASLRKQRGRKNNPMKTKLGTNTILLLYFKIME